MASGKAQRLKSQGKALKKEYFPKFMLLLLLVCHIQAQMANITLYGLDSRISTRLVGKGKQVRILVKQLLPATNYTLYVSNRILNGNCNVKTGGFARDFTNPKGIAHFGFKLVDKELKDLVGLGIVVRSQFQAVCGNVEEVYYSLPNGGNPGSTRTVASTNATATVTTIATEDASATKPTTDTATATKFVKDNPNLIPSEIDAPRPSVKATGPTPKPKTITLNPNLPFESGGFVVETEMDQEDPSQDLGPENNSDYGMGLDFVWVTSLVVAFF
jgi:hypothetical protein